MMEMIEYYNADDPENIQHYWYKCIQWEYFIEDDLKYFPIASKITKNSPYIDIGSGFDIETTNIPDEHKATMYIWQWSLNDLVIYGRSWNSFQDFFAFLVTYYELNAKKKLLVFIHNMSFEFSFIKRLIKWDKGREGWPKVFALDGRQVVKAEAMGIEFRDSAILTQLSLAKLAKDYGLKYQKLVGDLDYKIIRFGGSDPTPLSNKELPYCFNDVLILSSFFNQYIKEEYIKKKIKIPLTATGIPRDQMKRNFKKMAKKAKYIHESDISKAFPPFEMYKIMIEYLYRGGYVHSDPALTDETIFYGLGSVDFKSAYPAVLLQEKYPYEFIECSTELWPRLLDKRITKDEAFFGEFTFYNIESKGKISYESKNKCVSYSDAKWDNGRLWKASSVTVWLTELDFQIYKDVYNFENVKCHKLYKSLKRELPEFVKDLILEFYYIKESMNKFGKDSIERLNAKKKLNAIYGMMVTSLYFLEYHFNEETGTIESIDSGKTYDELIEKQLLLPQWGIWCTAYVRYRLIHYGFMKCVKDAIYGDTDSVKLKNYDANAYVFDDFNNMIRRINQKMYVGKYERSIFKDLGIFDYEGKMLKAKFLGCKRYLCSKAKYDKKKGKYYLYHESTVAGMKKGTLQAYCKAENKDIYESFTNGLCLDLSFSKKLTSIYTDEPFEAELTDYRAHTATIKEQSCVALIEIPFKLTMDHIYLAFLDEIKKSNQNRLIKRNYGGML